ncbi:MAG: hypothetical protein J6T53_01280 [Bacteroidales bacterium]|nr:hypothetical protein [Bacteroidales bacterium]
MQKILYYEKTILLGALAMLILTGCSKKQSIYDFSVKDIDGKDIFDKIDVNGENESPLYTYLKAQAPFAGYPEGGEEFGDILTQIHQQTGTGFEQGDAIKWNFGKFLVSRDGKTIIRFEPMVTPDMMEEAIEGMLK